MAYAIGNHNLELDLESDFQSNLEIDLQFDFKLGICYTELLGGEKFKYPRRASLAAPAARGGGSKTMSERKKPTERPSAMPSAAQGTTAVEIKERIKNLLKERAKVNAKDKFGRKILFAKPVGEFIVTAIEQNNEYSIIIANHKVTRFASVKIIIRDSSDINRLHRVVRLIQGELAPLVTAVAELNAEHIAEEFDIGLDILEA